MFLNRFVGKPSWLRRAMAPVVLLLTLAALASPTPSYSQEGQPGPTTPTTAYDGSVSITAGSPTPADAAVGDDVSTQLQMSVSNAPTGLDGPYYNWGCETVQYSSDGQTWQEADPESYSAGFPDGDGLNETTRLVNGFDKPGYWKVTVRSTASYYEDPEGPIYITGYATLATVHVTSSGGGSIALLAAVDSAPKLTISIGNTDVTNKVQRVIVGQKMLITASLKNVRETATIGTDPNAPVFAWTVPTKAMEKFEVAGATSRTPGQYPATSGHMIALTRKTRTYLLLSGLMELLPGVQN